MVNDPRNIAALSILAITVFGTGYSLAYNTYLDTSNPLLTNLPHPLHKTHYFANKANLLNVYFIKRAWGWTSAAFLALFLTSPSRIRHRTRVWKWLVATGLWLAFTGWFFGPALLERVIVASGGQCVLEAPDGSASIVVPNQYCYTHTTITPETHPSLFARTGLLDTKWLSRPRLRRGHDVSGHLFLLTMSVLFLADQLRSSLSLPFASWSSNHRYAVLGNVTLIAIWLFASYTTSVYFHTAAEKLSGLCEYRLCGCSIELTVYQY
jgi:hypothetical protein